MVMCSSGKALHARSNATPRRSSVAGKSGMMGSQTGLRERSRCTTRHTISSFALGASSARAASWTVSAPWPCGEGRIVASGPDVVGTARQKLEFPDGLLVPGLVDLHAHPARGCSRFGIDPDLHFLPRGVTTVLSQGDAGALQWPAYRDQVIVGSRTRVRLAIHLSLYGESRPNGCFQDLADADVEACVAAIKEGGEAIWGIAVNVGDSGPVDPRDLLDRAREVAERTQRPPLRQPLCRRLDAFPTTGSPTKR